MSKFVFAEPSREVFWGMEPLSVSSLRKVTHLTAQKHAASGQFGQLMALSACIIAVNPIGTGIATYLLERMLKELLIEYE